jgi:glycosyltransferase involved in cell wall biosynthesis
VKHHRTEDDIKLDKGRNLDIFTHWVAKDPSRICHRMKYYWGKELFEADKPLEAFPKLIESIADPKLEHHDRLLGIQYASLSAMKCNQLEKAIQIAHQGLQLDPLRAEYYVIIADCYVKLNKLPESIPFYEAARSSLNKVTHSTPAAIFTHSEAYGQYPTNQLARVKYHLQDFEGALKESQMAVDKWGSHESKEMVKEILKGIDATKVSDEAVQTEDIVITTPPQTAYEWDESKYKVKAMGGSETAAIEMASWLKKLTGRSVKIFNMRETDLIAPSGVEYLPVKNINKYFSQFKPKVHIAWRHNTKLTTAPTYVWCHDLQTPGAESSHLYDKIMCLTPFHSRHVQAMQGVPADKIMITRNGLNVGRFRGINAPRNPNKIVFPSSPDRGLKEAMLVCDEVIKSHPSIELHVFYGIEHLGKYGLQKMADELKSMMDARPWVKYHGATEQNDLAMHLKSAAIWLHPCDFIETSCITAMEMLVCGVYPVTRRLGGLMNTLSEAESKGMATLLDVDPAEDLTPYIVETKRALDEKLWEKVDVNPESYSWECVAKEWIKAMGLETDKVSG